MRRVELEVWKQTRITDTKSRGVYEMHLELPTVHLLSPAAFESLTCGVLLEQSVIQ